jgi:hypothetical protein
MDAIEFIKQLRRMDEKGVPKNRFIYLRVGRETDSPEDVVAEVEEWVKMNPVKTRQSVFLEQWPNARPADDGVLTFCPKRFDFHISCLAECHSLKKCSDCRREFWMQEVE